MSPDVGVLDEEALEQYLDESPDDALAMLADLTGATDPALRALARRLAAQVFLQLAARGPARPRGVGRLATHRLRDEPGDLDVDASIDAVVSARAARAAPDPDELWVRQWRSPATALSLVVDRSGSMTGRPLATAAVAAAAVAWRAPVDYSVVSFGSDVVIARSQGSSLPPETVIDRVLALRGFGTTDVAAGLAAAQEQLARSAAKRKVTVLLSDCRSTVPSDPLPVARRLDELVIVAPAGDADQAIELAEAVGARVTTVSGPSDAAAALTRVLDR